MRTALRSEAKRCIHEYAQLPGIAAAGGSSGAGLVYDTAGAASAGADQYSSGQQETPPAAKPSGFEQPDDVQQQQQQQQAEVGAEATAFSTAGLTRSQWAVHQPAQLAIVVSNIFWCQAVESALDGGWADGQGGGVGAALGALMSCCGAQLEELIRLVRGGLTELQRRVSWCTCTSVQCFGDC